MRFKKHQCRVCGPCMDEVERLRAQRDEAVKLLRVVRGVAEGLNVTGGWHARRAALLAAVAPQAQQDRHPDA